MKRIELIAPMTESKDLIDYIQTIGVIELIDTEPDDHFFNIPTSSSVSQLDRYLVSANEAKAVLDKYAPQKRSLLDSFSARKEMTFSDYLKKSDEANEIIGKCYDISEHAKRIADNGAAIVRTQVLMDALEPWISFDLPTSEKGTEKTVFFIGTLPGDYTRESLMLELAQRVPEIETVDAEIISSSRDQTCVFLIGMKENKEELEAALRAIGFVRHADPTKHPPGVRYERYKKSIDKLYDDIDRCTKAIKEYGDIHPDIEFLIDYLTVRRDKYDVLGTIEMDDRVFVLNGYIPEPYIDKLVKKLESKFTVAISITEPEEDEEPPILLENNSFAAPVESVTEMYSMPSNRDVDPNPVMAFFYYVFFGLMLSDAGYGLVMVIAMLFAKAKLKLEPRMKKTVDMFLYCGIATVFWGAMFGSWFGDLIQVIAREFFGKELGSLALWMEPVDKAMDLMLYCFLFGIIHLFVGYGVRFYQLWKAGKKLDAICDTVFTYLFIGGIAPIGANLVSSMPPLAMQIGKYCLIAGAAGIVLTSGRSAKNIFGKLGGGLYGMYNAASGALGDVLSYSRLLALGLSTGVIAQVVNMLGIMPGNKIAKAICLVFVAVFGHTVNIGINLIGTYVHTNRLQYVEFFSKFYEGGGRSFTPLRSNTKYYNIKEEI